MLSQCQKLFVLISQKRPLRNSYYFAYRISSQVLSGVGEGGPEVRVGVLPHDGGDVGVDQRLDESAEELHGLKHNKVGPGGDKMSDRISHGTKMDY